MKKSVFKLLSVMALMVFLLAACGGGGTSDETGETEHHTWVYTLVK